MPRKKYAAREDGETGPEQAAHDDGHGCADENKTQRDEQSKAALAVALTAQLQVGGEQLIAGDLVGSVTRRSGDHCFYFDGH